MSVRFHFQEMGHYELEKRMAKKLLEISAEIVQSQVANAQMSAEEIVSSLKLVFNALQEIQRSEVEGIVSDVDDQEELAAPEERDFEKKVNPRDSIQEEKIICLECGTEMRQLTAKHLGSHELTPREYKRKWGFPLTQSLSAKALSKARSKAARKRGLPENLRKFQEERKQRKMESSAPEESFAEEVPTTGRQTRRRREE
jgi:predicted transcriptional regulator